VVETPDPAHAAPPAAGVSVLYREPMWLKLATASMSCGQALVSVLYREPMWLKRAPTRPRTPGLAVSVLYREPMWLKLERLARPRRHGRRFSALP